MAFTGFSLLSHLIFQLISDFLMATLPQALKLTARRDLAMYSIKEKKSRGRFLQSRTRLNLIPFLKDLDENSCLFIAVSSCVI